MAGTEDLLFGFLELAGRAPHEAVAGNAIAFRTLTPLLLTAPLVLSAGDGVPQHPGREVLCALLSVPLLAALALYAALGSSPSSFLALLSRRLDFLSASLFAAALLVYFREFRRSRNKVAWWLGLSIGVMLAGQSLLLFSREIYDPFFAASRVGAILGYAVSLLGFSLHQLSVEDDQNWTIFRMSAEVDRINSIYLEDVVLETVGPFNLVQCPLVDADPEAQYLVHAIGTGFRLDASERPHLPARLVESVDTLLTLMPGEEEHRG